MKQIALLKLQQGQSGGLEKTAHAIANGFAQAGLQPVWITLQTLGIRQSLHFVDHLRLQRRIRSLPFPLIFSFDRFSPHTHHRAGNGCHRSWLQMRPAGFLKRMSFALNPLHHTLLQLEKKAFEDPSLQVLFTNSELVKRQILEHYQVKAPIAVVHNGVDWRGAASAFEQWKEVPSSKPTLLFAGHGFARKGLALLLRALRRFDAKLLVVGRDRHIDQFREQARGLDVHFLGPQPSIAAYLQQADAAVLPTIYDPFANVIAEALAMGVFCITSKMNGASEILSPQTGIVLAELEEECLVQALQRIAPKTRSSASHIRALAKGFDESSAVRRIVEMTLNAR